MIGKWSVERYTSLTRRWVVVAAVVVVAGVLTSQRRELIALWEILVLGGIGRMVFQVGGGKVEGLTAGAIVGAALGAAASVARYIHDPTLSSGLNIIIETILTTVVGPFIAVSVVIVSSIYRRQQH